MEKTTIEIHDTYITLGQFLKFSDIISSGGMAKPFLQQMKVYVNEEFEDRRGKKLYDGDTIKILNIGEFQIKAPSENDG